MNVSERMKKFPKRLTISFPLFMIYATPGENSPFYDIDRLMLETKERGFNTIRIDSGIGFNHDLDGKLRGKFYRADTFGDYEALPRQFKIFGEPGYVDTFARLCETLEAAKRHGIYVILSQWYYLHSYWFHQKGCPICEEMFKIPVEERIDVFGRLWHYLLSELEVRGLCDNILFCELFNEINAHPYFCGDPVKFNGYKATDDECRYFRSRHEAALEMLGREHPEIPFAYDTEGHRDALNMPQNAQVYNFHSYFMWGIYDTVYKAHPEYFGGGITASDVAASREGRIPAVDSWNEMIAKHYDLKKSVFPELYEELERTLAENFDSYASKMEQNLNTALSFAGERPVICGEGVSYICSKELLWEENSPLYFGLVKLMLKKYKEAGVWGTVLRTCCAPDDPSWKLIPEKILELNRYFLEN